jgi:hypothetical protein
MALLRAFQVRLRVFDSIACAAATNCSHVCGAQTAGMGIIKDSATLKQNIHISDDFLV